MGKVVIVSDLHLGITSANAISEMVYAIEAEKPDLTVLAGDIGEGLENFRACLKLFAHIPGDVAVIAGNHDVWALTDVSSQELWERALPDAVKDVGMIWLEETDWRYGAVAVVGSLAWYDYSAADPKHSRGFSCSDLRRTTASKTRF
jgi:predicted phosphohydrolase